MPSAYVIKERSSIHLKSKRLEVFSAQSETSEESTRRSIPLNDIERLVVNEDVQISARALAECLRMDIPISFMGWNDKYLGGFLPATPAHGKFRIRQYRKTLDADFTVRIARRIIEAKIYNQRRVLQRLDAARAQRREDGQENVDMTARLAAGDMEGYLKAMAPVATVDEIRGYEGASTSRYFRAWSTFLPENAPFERRSTRPPLNAVNACVSFGSTLLYQECLAFLNAHGLDPSLGTLHTVEDGRWSLALDLIEPFRPCVSESLTLDMFSRGMLNPDVHFESRDGGVYLNGDGRRKFLLQYERRMDRQFMSEHAGHRTTLRQQLETQGTEFKRSLEEPDGFKPFKMN